MLNESATTALRLPPTRRTYERVRLGIYGALAVAVVTLAACDKHTNTAMRTAATTVPASRAPIAVAGYPYALHLVPHRAFNAFVDLQYGDRSVLRWYMGFSAAQDGHTLRVGVDALASTPEQAGHDCAAIAGAAAFFMKDLDYTLEVAGQVGVPAPTYPGAIIYEPAKFAPVSCPRPAGAPVDPFRADAPRTSDGAVTRFLEFLDKYYRGLGATDGSWYAGYAYGGEGPRIAVSVRDRTAAIGITRCAIIRPLAAWLLGPYATQFTVQVRGVTATSSTAWAAVDCP